MGDRPIIFSAPMIRALVEGRKTQTRRIYKVPAGSYVEQGRVWAMTDGCKHGDAALPCAPGDRLWVREGWKPIPASRPGGYFVPGSPFYGCDTFYRADSSCPLWADGPWKSPIHMSRRASRLTLLVTEVRVQRLQDISEADAQAEGLVEAYEGWATDRDGRHWGPDARASYRVLWNDLHGEDAWDRNPWVAALTFTVHRCNIDQMGGNHE